MNFMDFFLNLKSKYYPYMIAGGVAALLLIIFGGYFLFQNLTKPANQTANQKAAQEEVKKLVSEVGKLVDLPQGEDPTIATVTDVEKLKGQAFFQKAKNGDKVLIYSNAKKAILYDPVSKKVIDIAPINTGTPSAEVVSPSPSPKPTAKSSPLPTSGQATPSPSPSPSPTASATPNR